LSKRSNSVLVLLSGGVDSTALVQYYQSKNYKVKGVFIGYNQSSRAMEEDAVKRISKYYQIETEVVDLGMSLKQYNGEIYGRNALFVLIASGTISMSFSEIAIGIHLGVPYYDCSELFVSDCQNILDGYFNGSVTLSAPFLNYTKKQIYEYSIENKIPFDLTYSCEIGTKQPCNDCPSCADRRLLDELLSK